MLVGIFTRLSVASLALLLLLAGCGSDAIVEAINPVANSLSILRSAQREGGQAVWLEVTAPASADGEPATFAVIEILHGIQTAVGDVVTAPNYFGQDLAPGDRVFGVIVDDEVLQIAVPDGDGGFVATHFILQSIGRAGDDLVEAIASPRRCAQGAEPAVVYTLPQAIAAYLAAEAPANMPCPSEQQPLDVPITRT